jgi:sporulation protein YlmC with PRC-barrel domain
MKKPWWSFILLLGAFLLASNGLAQQQSPRQGQAMQPRQGQEQPDQPLHWAQKASDILDKKIVSATGEELGTAEDLVIGRDGKIEYVILSMGGFLGIGGERVVLPWDRIRSTPRVDQLVADVSKSELQWRAEEQRQARELDHGGPRQAAQDQGASPVVLAGLDAERAGEFVNFTVAGRGGEPLGRVTELLNSEEGRPLYVVVADESNRLHPVPAQLVLFDPEKKMLSARFDKQAFQNSPSYDRSQLAQLQWESEVRGYYEGGLRSPQPQ